MTLETVLTDMPIDIETFSQSDEEELTAVTNAERVVRFLYREAGKVPRGLTPRVNAVSPSEQTPLPT